MLKLDEIQKRILAEVARKRRNVMSRSLISVVRASRISFPALTSFRGERISFFALFTIAAITVRCRSVRPKSVPM